MSFGGLHTLDTFIEQCGGFRWFQARLMAIALLSKIPCTWSVLMMAFAAAVPPWTCLYASNETATSHVNFNNISYINSSATRLYKRCTKGNITCSTLSFDTDMRTVVNEWSLVCDKAWIPAMMTTVQMTGLLIGTLLGGQLADKSGRKPVYFLSLAFGLVSNFIAGFSVSWQMFTALRFVIGFSSGCYLVVVNTFVMEFIPTKHRSLVPCAPLWPFAGVLFGVVCMFLQNWRHVHIATAVIYIPFLLTWRWVPESFRWLASHNKVTEAENTIKMIAQLNRRPIPDLSILSKLKEKDQKAEQNYSILHLFRIKYLRKITLIFGAVWFACGFGYYGISFGAQNLSGNLYVNIILLNLIEIPSGTLAYFLTNRFGRRMTSIFFLAFASLSAFVVSAVQLTDLESKAKIMNGFTMSCKIGLSIAWLGVIVSTSEYYPTVVRNSGYGLQTSMARIGSMVAPQVLFLNESYPSLMLFLCAGLTTVSTVCLVFIPETKGKPLPDMIHSPEEREIELKNRTELNKIRDKEVNDNI